MRSTDKGNRGATVKSDDGYAVSEDSAGGFIADAMAAGSRSEFIGRCMADSTMKTAFPDTGKRKAACESKWTGGKAGAALDDMFGGGGRIQHRGVVCKTLGVDEEKREVTNVISREVVDRDREIVLVRGLGLDNFRKNPVVFFMHDPLALIGKSLSQKLRRRAGVNEMLAVTKFAETPLANEVFELQKGDFMRGASVGLNMRTMEMRDVTPDDVRKNADFADAQAFIVKAELLEYSIVTVPANPDALTAALNKGIIKLTEPILEPWLRAAVRRTKPKFVRVLPPTPIKVDVAGPGTVKVVTAPAAPTICKLSPADTEAKVIQLATDYNAGRI